MSSSGKFVIKKLGDTTIRVAPVQSSQVTSMRSTPDGGLAVERRSVREVIPGYQDDVFTATYAGDDEWDTDVNCGVMRWFGTKSNREIRAALRKCGFDKMTIDQVINEVKAAHKAQVHVR